MEEVGSGAMTPATASGSAALGGPVARFVDKLFQPVDAWSLGAFRVQFGVLMFWEVARYLAEDRVRRYFLEPRFLFTYEFFPFVRRGRAACSTCTSRRWPCAPSASRSACSPACRSCCSASATPTFFCSTRRSTKPLLPDQPALPAAAHGAGESWGVARPPAERRAGGGAVLEPVLLRGQIVLVYFYAGIAKLNADWLGGEPMRTWLADRAGYPVVGPFLATESFAAGSPAAPQLRKLR